MRVVFFTDTTRMGGAERVLEDLARGASDAGHDVIVLAPQDFVVDAIGAAVPGLAVQRFGDDGFRSASSPVGRASGALGQLPRLVSVMCRLRPDVLHVSNGGYPGSGLCCLALPASSIARVPRRILSVHAVPRPRSDSPPGVQASLDHLVWPATQTVIGATEIVRTTLAEARGMPPDRYVKIPYGVRPPAGAEEASAQRTRLGVDRDGLLVLMVSAASDEQKGHAVLAAALESVPQARAAIVGSIPPPAALARFEASELAHRVAVLGRVPDVGPLIHAADVVVVPSIADESLPLVVLEAMAAGKPVIASRLSGIPEAVVDGVTGRLFAPGDASALAGLLQDLARDRSTGRVMGDAGHDRWAERYSVDVMVRDTLAQYAPG